MSLNELLTVLNTLAASVASGGSMFGFSNTELAGKYKVVLEEAGKEVVPGQPVCTDDNKVCVDAEKIGGSWFFSIGVGGGRKATLRFERVDGEGKIPLLFVTSCIWSHRTVEAMTDMGAYVPIASFGRVYCPCYWGAYDHATFHSAVFAKKLRVNGGCSLHVTIVGEAEQGW